MKVRNCILLCDTASHSGGVSAVVLAQATGLHEAGVAVHVFAAHGPVDTALAAQCVSVHCMHAAVPPRNRWRQIWSRPAALALADFLQPFDTDDTVVHVHALSMGLSPAIAKPLRQRGFRTLVTAHDASWACPTGYFYNFQQSHYCLLEPLSLACLCSHCDKRSLVHKAYKVIKIMALDWASRLKHDAAVVLVPSELLRQRLRSRVPAATAVRTLANPVRATDLGPRTHPGDGFLFVGRLWEEKGIAELLQALDGRFAMVVIGDGPLLPALQRRHPQVLFKGWLDPEEVARAMRQARALVLPSLYLEAFGLTVAEALSQGVPVIVSRTAGAADLVQHGENGFLVDMHDAQQLQHSCAQLMDVQRAQAMSLCAYTRYWQAPLSTERYTRALLPILGGD